MSSLESFDKSLELLEKEVSNLSAIRQAYQKVEELSKTYSRVLNNVKDSSDSLKTSVAGFDGLKSEIEKSLLAQKEIVQNSLDALKSSIEKSLAQNAEVSKKQLQTLETSSQRQKEQIDNRFSSIQKSVNDEFGKVRELISTKTDDISSENKKFYKEFADMVQVRLDNNKGEIRQLIEHERSEIKQMIDNQTQALDSMQNNRLRVLEASIKKTKLVAIVFGIVVAVLCAAILTMILLK